MTRKILTILLLLPLSGISFFASAADSLLSGRYQFFETDKETAVVNNLTADSISGMEWRENCSMFFDVTGTGANKTLTDDTSVDEACMEFSLSQGEGWIWYMEADDNTWSWPAGDGATGPLTNSWANLSLFSITETETDDGVTTVDVFDTILAVTKDGVLALDSYVEIELGGSQTWQGGSGPENILIDSFDNESGIALKLPNDGVTLAVGNLNGRYLIGNNLVHTRCLNGTGPDDCTEAGKGYESEYLEVKFNGDGSCTIPVISEKEILQEMGTTLNKTIFYSDDKIFTTDGGNADETYDTDGTTVIASDWGIRACTYAVTNNILTISVTEFENGVSPDPTFEIPNLVLSDSALYFKYGGGVITEAGHGEILSLIGMKMETSLPTGLSGNTYLVRGLDVTDYAYDINAGDIGMFGDLSVYQARRYALTFDDEQGACTLHQAHDVTAIPTVESGTLELYTKESDISFSCSYTTATNMKSLSVTIVRTDGVIESKTFSARFSDDLNVIKMNHKSYVADAATPPADWELVLDSVIVASAFGVLLDETAPSQEIADAITNWVDPKYWVNIENNTSAGIVPIVTSYLLF